MTDPTRESPIETGQKKAEDTAEAAKSRASGLADEAKRAASDMASGAKARVEAEVVSRGEAARDSVATAVEDTAETLRTAAERMSDGTPQSEAVHRAANTVYGVAEQIRETSPKTAIDAVSTFARRHPAPFLAGAAMVGFAMGRFLKSSSRPDYDLDSSSRRAMAPPPPAPVRSGVPQTTASRTPASVGAPGGAMQGGTAPQAAPATRTVTPSQAAAGSTGGTGGSGAAVSSTGSTRTQAPASGSGSGTTSKET